MPLEQAFLQQLYQQIEEIFSEIAPDNQATFLNEVKDIVQNPSGFHFFMLEASEKLWLLIHPLSSNYANLSDTDRKGLSSLLAQYILTLSNNFKIQITQSPPTESKDEKKPSQLESKCLAIAEDIHIIKTMLKGASNTAVTIIPKTFTLDGYPLSLWLVKNICGLIPEPEVSQAYDIAIF